MIEQRVGCTSRVLHVIPVPLTTGMLEGMEISVNPLAVPKGKKLLCEICQQPAHLQCALCKVTCYWLV